jgi:hypothetical protein
MKPFVTLIALIRGITYPPGLMATAALLATIGTAQAKAPITTGNGCGGIGVVAIAEIERMSAQMDRDQISLTIETMNNIVPQAARQMQVLYSQKAFKSPRDLALPDVGRMDQETVRACLPSLMRLVDKYQEQQQKTKAEQARKTEEAKAVYEKEQADWRREHQAQASSRDQGVLEGLAGLTAYLQTCDQWHRVSATMTKNMGRMLENLPFTLEQRQASYLARLESVKEIGVGKFCSEMAAPARDTLRTLENIDWNK